MPEAVTRLQESIASADGLLIASPEYNNSMPGVAKNAIDWLSRTHERIEDGRLTDEKTRERLREFVQGFVEFVEGR